MAIATIPFEKLQGLGNDFVFVAARDILKQPGGEAFLKSWNDNLPELARALCDRRYGVGADGLILIVNIEDARERAVVAHYPDFEKSAVGWTYTNSDGSPSKMCGNGLRCAALFAVSRGFVKARRFAVATEVGPIDVEFENDDRITVDLGAPVLQPSAIPLAGTRAAGGKAAESGRFVGERLPGMNFSATCISMGNPHCVVFFDEPLGQEGLIFPEQHLQSAREIQALSLFPEGVNVEFAFAESRDQVRVSVLERGSGPTLACASGAAAVLVAGVLENRLNRRACVCLPGGRLTVDWSEDDGRVRLTGPAARSFTGSVDISNLNANPDLTLGAGPGSGHSQPERGAQCQSEPRLDRNSGRSRDAKTEVVC